MHFTSWGLNFRLVRSALRHISLEPTSVVGGSVPSSKRAPPFGSIFNSRRGVTIRSVARPSHKSIPCCPTSDGFFAAFTLILAPCQSAASNLPARATGSWKPDKVLAIYSFHSLLSCSYVSYGKTCSFRSSARQHVAALFRL